MISTNVKGTNIDITPDIRSYLDKRLQTLNKFIDADDTSTVCDVELERDTHHQTGNVFRAEITIHTRRGTNRAEAKGTTAEEAIDKVKKDITRELRRAKKKEQSRERRGGSKLKNFTHSLSERGIRMKEFVVGWRKKK